VPRFLEDGEFAMNNVVPFVPRRKPKVRLTNAEQNWIESRIRTIEEGYNFRKAMRWLAICALVAGVAYLYGLWALFGICVFLAGLVTAWGRGGEFKLSADQRWTLQEQFEKEAIEARSRTVPRIPDPPSAA
jgi:hypothetical protein